MLVYDLVDPRELSLFARELPVPANIADVLALLPPVEIADVEAEINRVARTNRAAKFRAYWAEYGKFEEITDPKRWQERVVRGRPLSATDFCMTLDALRELKAHGRVLAPDERFGLKILRGMQK